MWFISKETGKLYMGDCASGDREATEQEVAAYELDAAKFKKLLEINSAFEGRVLAGMPYGGGVLQLRPDDRANVTAVFSRAMAFVSQALQPVPGVTITWPPGGYPWRMLDDTYLLLSPQEFIDMAQQAADHYGALFYASRAMKDAADAADTVEQLAAIDTSQGWD
jgi:hypothetical protein